MGLSPTQIGLLFMIHSMGAALAYFSAGMLADHVANRGAILAVTFFWVSFGYLAASFSDGFWVFAILIAIASMGDAAWHPIATGVLAQIHKTKRAYALGMHSIGGHISEVIALPVCGFILTRGIGAQLFKYWLSQHSLQAAVLYLSPPRFHHIPILGRHKQTLPISGKFGPHGQA